MIYHFIKVCLAAVLGGGEGSIDEMDYLRDASHPCAGGNLPVLRPLKPWWLLAFTDFGTGNYDF